MIYNCTFCQYIHVHVRVRGALCQDMWNRKKNIYCNSFISWWIRVTGTCIGGWIIHHVYMELWSNNDVNIAPINIRCFPQLWVDILFHVCLHSHPFLWDVIHVWKYKKGSQKQEIKGGQTMQQQEIQKNERTNKALHKKLKIEQHEPH